MLTGSLKTFQRQRQALIGLSLAAPLLLLAGAWLWVDRVVLAPAAPGDQDDGRACLTFVCHERGLPRLSAAEAEKFLHRQSRRLIEDPAFARQFAAAVRTASPEELTALRRNVLLAFKPLVLRDARRCAELEGGPRTAYLDERIVAYNRMCRVAAASGVGRLDFGALTAVDAADLLNLVLNHTSPQERRDVERYLAVLRSRVEAILADEALRREFERRIAAPSD